MPGGLLQDDGDVQLGSDEVGGQGRLLLTKSAAFGTQASWATNTFNPWSAIEFNTNDIPFMHRPGVRASPDIPVKRLIEFEIAMRFSTNTAFKAAAADITRVTYPISYGEQELAFQIYGSKYVLFGRYRGIELVNPTSLGISPRIARWRIRFEATDPFIWNCATSQTIIPAFGSTVNLSSTSGYPNLAGVTGTTVTRTMLGGQAPVRWSVFFGHTVFTSPYSFCNPMLADLTNQSIVWMAGADIAAGFSNGGRGVTVSAFSRKATDFVNGNDVTRNIAWGTSWFELNPLAKSDYTISFVPRVKINSNFPGGTGGQCTLTWRAGWLTLG